ncbi:N-acetylaspartate synthetase-like isoform 2-T2 [Menidia menidia]
MTALCFVLSGCWWVLVLVPLVVVCLRYFYSRRVIRGYLKQALSTDMADIQGFYMNSPGSCLWVAVVGGRVVGAVAAFGLSHDAVELRRMCVDRRFRRLGAGAALGRRLLAFAAARRYSSVLLGTTAYTAGAHRLYLRLGFVCTGVTNGNATPGARRSLLERMFYRVRLHHYRRNLQATANGGNRPTGGPELTQKLPS